MSRLLVAALLATFCVSSIGNAQRLSDADIAAQIENARRLVAVDGEGCLKYPASDEIVVCGTAEENKRQRMDPSPFDKNRLRRGEAVSTKRAAACAFGDTLCRTSPSGGIPVGYVPPVALDYHKLMKGLPEPDMVVPEGSAPK